MLNETFKRLSSNLHDPNQLLDNVTKVTQMQNAIHLYTTIEHTKGSCEQVVIDELLAQIFDENLKHFNLQNGIFTVDSMPTVLGYPNLLKILFKELIKNAFQFRRDNKTVTINVGVKELENEWQFYIQDDGIGISLPDIDLIFGPFFTIGGNGSRSGMGLALCRRIVHLHNGRIWATSKPKLGTKIWFTLPKQEI